MKNRGAFIPGASGGELRRLFAVVKPNGKLDAVIDAYSQSDAWVIATGWGDQVDIAERIDLGWRIYPCVVEWEENE